jgi:hypothetical protein
MVTELAFLNSWMTATINQEKSFDCLRQLFAFMQTAQSTTFNPENSGISRPYGTCRQ